MRAVTQVRQRQSSTRQGRRAVPAALADGRRPNTTEAQVGAIEIDVEPEPESSPVSDSVDRVDREPLLVEPEEPAQTPSKRPRQVTGTVLFDLETQKSAAEVGGWQNAHKMLVAVGVACFWRRDDSRPTRRIELPSSSRLSKVRRRSSASTSSDSTTRSCPATPVSTTAADSRRSICCRRSAASSVFD